MYLDINILEEKLKMFDVIHETYAFDQFLDPKNPIDTLIITGTIPSEDIWSFALAIKDQIYHTKKVKLIPLDLIIVDLRSRDNSIYISKVVTLVKDLLDSHEEAGYRNIVYGNSPISYRVISEIQCFRRSTIILYPNTWKNKIYKLLKKININLLFDIVKGPCVEEFTNVMNKFDFIKNFCR